MSCWKEAGAPTILNNRIRTAASLIGKVYEHAAAGGACHIAVDDWNLDDGSIQFCRQSARSNTEEYRKDISRKQRRAEAECADFLATLTEDERYSALALYNQFFKES